MRGHPNALLALVLCVLATMLLAPAGTAAASDAETTSPGISFRTADGPWVTSLPAPLFDEQLLWVPGDTRTATFLVRNDSSEEARLQIEGVTSVVDDLIRVGELTVEARVDGEDWRSTTEPGTHDLSSRPSAPGEVRTIDVRVTLPWDAANPSQQLSVMFDLRVTLIATSAGVGPAGDAATGPDSRRAGGLPTTGGVLSPAVLVSAFAMIAVGAALSARRRPRMVPARAGEAS